MIDGDHTVVLDECLPAEAVPLNVRVQCHRKIAPVDQIVAHGVSPVDAVHSHRSELVEHVIATLPLAKPVGVVHVVLRRREVIEGPVRVDLCQSLPGSPEPKDSFIRLNGAELFV